MDWKIAGAVAFGAVIGWFLYFINRYRKGDVSIGDITTVIGAIGGAAVLSLFSKESDLFGAYGIGLAAGFFGYFLSLIFLVSNSNAFTTDWFLDGRRPDPPAGWGFGADNRQPVANMAINPNLGGGGFHGVNPGVVQNFQIPAGAPAALQMPAMALLNPNAQRIIDACRAVWPARQNACNFFVTDVADRMGVTLTGLADAIVDQIQGPGWLRLADGQAAHDAALQGKLVVAGIKAADFTHPRTEGHVAIVVAGSMIPGGWAPPGYWGSTSQTVAARGGDGSPLSWSFRAEDKDRIVYAACDV
jgi:hypothetical protein